MTLGALTDAEGTGKATVGRAHIAQSQISVCHDSSLVGVSSTDRAQQRQDVAQTLALLLDREDAAGLALDVVGGEAPIAEALDAAIKKRHPIFLG